jgi:hypothetical protein
MLVRGKMMTSEAELAVVADKLGAPTGNLTIFVATGLRPRLTGMSRSMASLGPTELKIRYHPTLEKLSIYPQPL